MNTHLNDTHKRTHTGLLPAEWGTMPVPANGTGLDLSYNDLLGPFPDAWGARSSGWRSVAAVGNARMCGALPTWFTARFAGVNTTAMIAGAGACRCSNLFENAWQQFKQAAAAA